MPKGSRVLAILLCLGLLLAACTDGDSTDTTEDGGTDTSEATGTTEATDTTEASSGGEQILRAGQVNDIAGIEPYRTSISNWVYTSNVFDYLAEDLRGESGLQPHALADFVLSDDNMTLTLTLREGVTTHAGNPVTAEMVASNFNDRMLVEENGGGYYRRMSPVIESVVATDDTTVVISFSEPSPQITGVLSTIAISDPEGFIRSDGSVAAYNQSEQLISTGPFVFQDYVPEQGWTMAKFDDYREADSVALDAVEVSIFGDTSTMIAALEAGEIDYAFNVPSDEAVRLMDNDQVEVHVPEAFSLMYVTYLNPSRSEALRDPRLRQAIDLVSDRVAMNAAGFAGLGSAHTACFPETSIAYDASLEVDPASDVDAATALLEGVTLPTEPLVMPVPSTNPTLLALTEILAANLQEIGIPVTIETMDQSAWAERLQTVDFDVLVSLTGVVSEHPALQWDTRFFQPTGNALLEGVTDEYIEAYQAAYAEGLTLSGDAASAKWQEANRALKDGAWMHCLVAAPIIHATSADVDGFTWNGVGMPVFRDVTIGG